MDKLEEFKTPDGRVLPDDIRCNSCKVWIRGGPGAMHEKLNQAIAANIPTTASRVVVPIVSLVVGVVMIAFIYLSMPMEGTPIAIRKPLGTIVALATIAAGAWIVVRHKYYGGKWLGISGASVGVCMAPVIGLVVILVKAFS